MQEFWREYMADTLQMHLHTMNMYIWAKGHPGKTPPNTKVVLFSEIAHRKARKRNVTDTMTADQLKNYIANKL